MKNLRDAKPPETKAELRSFLGMAGYSMRFIGNFAAIVHPLRELLKAEKWSWDEYCKTAFEEVKDSLSEQTLLHHYMPGRETELVVDASNTGLGACLLQKPSKHKPFQIVAYKSRTLKDAETRYSATEKEALAIRWAARKFRNLLLGAPKFRIISDHKPLQYMFNKVTGEVPPRIEKFIMDIQELDYVVEYRPGAQMIADYMSRKHAARKGTSPTAFTELTAKNVVGTINHPVLNADSAVTINDIKEETKLCLLTNKIMTMINDGDGDNDPDLAPYKRMIDDLSIIDGIVCRNSRIFIPPKLQQKVVKVCHRSHQGISKTKSYARSFCWFPGLDALIERKVSKCRLCQVVQDKNLDQPTKPNELPTGPWEYVEMDFQGPYPNGEYIFVMIDRYSRWPEIATLGSAPNASTTCKAMLSIIQNKGVPGVCQSDNGPPFQSEEMCRFATEWGYTHKHITPEWPLANGMVERFNRSMKEAVQVGHLEGKTIRKAAADFLQMYRATPHSATGVSPFEAMHGGRKMKGKLPILPNYDNVVSREKDHRYKQQMREKSRGEDHSLVVGNKVLMRNKKENKLTPKFDPTEMTVIGVKGSSVTASDGRRVIFRDASFFKRIDSEDEEETPISGDRELPTEDNEPTPPNQDETGEGPDDQNPIEPTAQTQPAQGLAAGREVRTRQPPARLRDYVC